ncbi:hypothetical protein ACIBEJ_36600 [Nonomuraea sp. NPDC050790]|uniref:hypothetical protein n=1 Tax=Nonomuraea sp. NPDC050790 TaxID=3364371 RepID=UPI00379138A7
MRVRYAIEESRPLKPPERLGQHLGTHPLQPPLGAYVITTASAPGTRGCANSAAEESVDHTVRDVDVVLDL